MKTVVGIDMSMQGLALVAIPAAWTPGDWDVIRFASLGTTAGESMAVRRAKLAEDVVRWIGWVTNVLPGPFEVVHEGYPSGGRVYNLDVLCELGGVVKHELRRQLGVEVSAVPLVSARKTLLGWVPRKEAKKAVQQVLTMADAPFADADQADAFVVANHHRSLLGMPFCAGMLGAKPEAPRRRRRTRAELEGVST